MCTRSLVAASFLISMSLAACAAAPGVPERATARAEAADGLVGFSLVLEPPPGGVVVGTVGLEVVPAVGAVDGVPSAPAAAVEAWMDDRCDELLAPEACDGATVVFDPDAAPVDPPRHPCERWRDATRLSEVDRTTFLQQCMERTASCASLPAAEQTGCAELAAFAHYAGLDSRVKAAHPTLFVDPAGAVRFGRDVGGPVVAYMATKRPGAATRPGVVRTALVAITLFVVTGAILDKLKQLQDDQDPRDQEDDCAERIARASSSVTADTGTSVPVLACCDAGNTFLSAPSSIGFLPQHGGAVLPSTIVVRNVGVRSIAVANGFLETAAEIPSGSSWSYRVQHEPGGSLWGYCEGAWLKSGGISYFTQPRP